MKDRMINARSANALLKNHGEWLDEHNVELEPVEDGSDSPSYYYVCATDEVFADLLKLI